MKSEPDFSVYNQLSSRYIPGMTALRSMIDESGIVSECPGVTVGRNICTWGMGPESSEYLTEVIAHLNDAHGWTFDDVADWIEKSGHDIKLPDENFVI